VEAAGEQKAMAGFFSWGMIFLKRIQPWIHDKYFMLDAVKRH
jgi:hypothetical protein